MLHFIGMPATKSSWHFHCTGTARCEDDKYLIFIQVIPYKFRGLFHEVYVSEAITWPDWQTSLLRLDHRKESPESLSTTWQEALHFNLFSKKWKYRHTHLFFHLTFYKEVANMHAGFVLPLECADTYLSKHQSGSKIEMSVTSNVTAVH